VGCKVIKASGLPCFHSAVVHGYCLTHYYSKHNLTGKRPVKEQYIGRFVARVD
jgi:hypothetical protein